MTARTEAPEDEVYAEVFDRLSRVVGAVMSSNRVGLGPQQTARCALGVALGALMTAFGDQATADMLRQLADEVERSARRPDA